MRGLSLVAASGGHSSSRCAGLSPSRPLLLRSTGSRRAGSVIVAHGPSCSVACRDLPRPGLEPVSPALAGGFSTTAPPGKPQNSPFWSIHSVAFRVFTELCNHPHYLISEHFHRPWKKPHIHWQVPPPLTSPTAPSSQQPLICFLFVWICYRKGGPFQGPRVGSCLTLGNELSEETRILTGQKTLLGRGARAENSGIREPRRTAVPRGSHPQVLWWWG